MSSRALGLRRSAALGAGIFALLVPLGAAYAQQAGAVVTEDEIVSLALAKNPTLAAAVADRRRADAAVDGEEHRYSFSLLLDTSFTHSSSPTLSTSGVVVPVSTTYRTGAQLSRHLPFGTDITLRLEGTSTESQMSTFNAATNPPSLLLVGLGPGYGANAKLSLTQPLLRNAGRQVYEAELEAARASRDSATSAEAQSASQLLLDVLTAYWEFYYATSSVEIQRQSLALARARRDDTAARVRTGSLPPVDLLSYETRVASLEEDVQSALAEELRRAIELARLTGDPSVRTKRADAARAPPDGGGIGPDVRARVLSSSFELSQQRAVVRLAEVQARTAENPYRPRLDLEGYLQAQGLGNREVLPAFSQLAGLGAVSAFVSLTYEAPLDSTRREQERVKADMVIAAAKARLTALEQKLIASLDNAVTQFEYADRRIALAERTRVIAEQQLDAENARYVTGSGTALQVREAEDSVRSARLREVRARADRIEARLTLEHLSGALLARRGGAR